MDETRTDQSPDPDASEAWASLNARWDLTSQRIVRETRANGLLSREDLDEDEIAAIAVEATRLDD